MSTLYAGQGLKKSRLFTSNDEDSSHLHEFVDWVNNFHHQENTKDTPQQILEHLLIFHVPLKGKEREDCW